MLTDIWDSLAASTFRVNQCKEISPYTGSMFLQIVGNYIDQSTKCHKPEEIDRLMLH